MQKRIMASAAAVALAMTMSAQAGEVIYVPFFGPTFTDCGTMVVAGECGLLLDLDHGGLVTAGGLEEFEEGDRVKITGQYCLTCLLFWCGVPYSAVITESAVPCEDKAIVEPIEPTDPIEACMTIIEDPDCGVLMQDDLGRLFLPGSAADQIEIGGSYLITGDMLAALMSFCPDNPSLDIGAIVNITVGGCTGDLNVDGYVNGLDLGILLAHWLEEGSVADLNGDLTVDGLDLGILLANWSL